MKRFGATETYLPEEIPEMYRSNFETIGKADLTRSGDNANVFAPGIPTVMEFTGTEDGLQLAGELVKAHGRLGIGGYHNDGPRSIDYKLRIRARWYSPWRTARRSSPSGRKTAASTP